MRTTLTPTKKLRPSLAAQGASLLLLLVIAACGSSAPTTLGDSGAPDANVGRDANPGKDARDDTGSGPKKDGGSDATCPVCVVGTAAIGQCCLE